MWTPCMEWTNLATNEVWDMELNLLGLKGSWEVIYDRYSMLRFTHTLSEVFMAVQELGRFWVNVTCGMNGCNSRSVTLRWMIGRMFKCNPWTYMIVVVFAWYLICSFGVSIDTIWEITAWNLRCVQCELSFAFKLVNDLEQTQFMVVYHCL